MEDLHWADAFTHDIICDYIIFAAGHYSSTFSSENRSRSLMLLGNYRDDEVPEEGFLVDKIKLLEQSLGNMSMTNLSIGELSEEEINKMLSFKFCLPVRYTRELAQLVYHKTRGHPLFVIAFMQSIIQRKLITFSVKARRWTWDDIAIELQIMSENVAEFLTEKFQQLPSDVIEMLKVASCFGQVNMSTIHLLDLGQFVPNMLESLESAVKEGIIERAGPIFAFSHDMLQESSYSRIPTDERKNLHKKIAMSLVQDQNVAENPELCTLAVDQINLCISMNGVLNPAECRLFAQLNLAAGKHSMFTKRSNYEQGQWIVLLYSDIIRGLNSSLFCTIFLARCYFEAGISLLHDKHCEKQHALSLELFEWSVVVSFMDGMIEAVSSRLDDP